MIPWASSLALTSNPPGADGCTGWGCVVDGVTSAVVGGALEDLQNAALEMAGVAMTAAGTVWVHIGSPVLTGGGEVLVDSSTPPPGTGQLVTVLDYVMWIFFALAGLGMVIAVIVLVVEAQRGTPSDGLRRVGLVFGAVIGVSAAIGGASALLRSGPETVTGVVGFLQGSLWWYMGALVVVSIIVGGIRLVWEQRAKPAQDVLLSLITVVVVSGAGATIIGLLVAGTDRLASWILMGSLQCDVATDASCFGDNMLTMLSLTATAPFGTLLLAFLAFCAGIAGLTQIILMVARSGVLVLLTGVLPFASAATNTDMGRSFFMKLVAWVIAFIAYKPAAAIVYATAFQLTGTSLFVDDGTGLVTILAGLMMFILALAALPALMRLITPAAAAMAGAGAGSSAGMAALAILPSGAAGLGRLAGGGFGANESGASDSTRSPSGASPSSTGAPPPSTTGLPSGAPTEAADAASAASSTASTTTTATTAGTASGAAVAGGPVGLAVAGGVQAAQVAGDAIKTASGAAQDLGESATGEKNDG